MNIKDIVCLNRPPSPWAEAKNIPWDEPGFSKRMLKEHLDQAHDMASRSFTKIDEQVRWVHEFLLKKQPSNILDLGCGPGFYINRLTELGHTGHGIDISPASIEYARSQATADNLSSTFVHGDIRQADFGQNRDLVMFIFGEPNVFPRDELARVLVEALEALRPGGVFLIEPHTFDAMEKIGNGPPSWSSTESGLFSDQPYICLTENFWDQKTGTATIRFLVIEAETGQVELYGASYQAYTDAEYVDLLKECGFTDIIRHTSLTGNNDEPPGDLFAITAKKK